jgi:hypothetical protein
MSEHAEHADLEALSAFVDGEAPEWADHVAGCEACAGSVAALRAVARAVATPVDVPDRMVRERAIAAALAGPEPVANVRRSRRSPGIPTRWLVPAVAAMILFLVGGAAVVTMGGRRSSNETATVSAPESSSKFSAGSGAAADSSAAPGPVTDLGDVPDAATLAARARPGLTSRTASGAAGAATATPAAPSGLAAPVPAPAVVGTRPCEEQARARQPSLGPVVYFATARRGSVPAVVLGFSTGPDPAQVTLLMLAQDGCGELLRVGP